MGTRLKRNIGRRPTRGGARLNQRYRFGMRAPSGLCPAAAENSPVAADDEATDGGVGRDAPESARGQPQRMAHKTDVVGRSGAQSRSVLESSPTKVSKSFASRKFL